MPLLNYTTTVDIYKTMGEIQKILGGAGATSISIDYRNGEPSAITFVAEVKGEHVNFRLPSRWEGVHARLQEIRGAKKTEAQARRVSWRIIKVWVAAQMALIDVEVATLAEVFLPYAVTPSGLTLYQTFEQNTNLLLSGKNE